jgi:hypothetical protein
LNNITAGVREREDANRTRVAGHLDEIQGVVANTLKVIRPCATASGEAAMLVVVSVLGQVEVSALVSRSE